MEIAIALCKSNLWLIEIMITSILGVSLSTLQSTKKVLVVRKTLPEVCIASVRKAVRCLPAAFNGFFLLILKKKGGGKAVIP